MTKTLGVIKWFLLLPCHVLVVLASYILAPVAVTWFSTNDKLFLKFPFRWLETSDNLMNGDIGWREEHLIGDDPLSWLNRVRWMWRNGGNTVNYKILGVPANQDWILANKSNPGPVWWDGEIFCVRYVFWGLKLDAGWNLLGPQNGRCKFWLSLRKAK